MLGSAAGKPIELSDTQEVARKAGGIASKKIWLPKLVYDGLPYFYLAAGFAAFFATMYISEWFWVLPHYLLFSAACIHLGVVISKRRSRSESDTRSDQDAAPTE